MSISSVNGVASTVSRYRFVAAGGETSLTGSDANGATLSYLAGKEEVYLNGVLLVRGQDYTGTDGATISALTALVAGDTVEIITFVPFAIPTAISSATVTTQGDLIVATGASAVTRLGVGSSGQILTSNGTTPAYTSTVTGTLNNGTLTGTLTAASSAGTSGQLLSSTGTGVQWVAAPAAGSITLLSTTTLSGASTTVSSISQSYKNLYIVIGNATFSTGPAQLVATFNGAGGIFTGVLNSIATGGNGSIQPSSNFDNAASNTFSILVNDYTNTTIYPSFLAYGGEGYTPNKFIFGGILSSKTITSFTFAHTATAFTGGTIRIYGVN